MDCQLSTGRISNLFWTLNTETQNRISMIFILFISLMVLWYERWSMFSDDEATLRLPHRNNAGIAKICNLWPFWLVIQLINNPFKIWQEAFCPMLYRCRKCSNILKLASVGGGETASLKACHFSPFQLQLCHQRSLQECRHTFHICEQLVKKATFRFLKDRWLEILSSKMSRRCPSNVLQDIQGDDSIKRACYKNLNVAFLTNGP